MKDTATWNQLADEIRELRAENTMLRGRAKPDKQLVYVASPFGNRRENYVRAEGDLLRLTETYPQHDFISPIVSFGYAYDCYSYEKGINICLALLVRCDAIWILHDDGLSKGVKIERKFAEEHHIPVVEYNE